MPKNKKKKIDCSKLYAMIYPSICGTGFSIQYGYLPMRFCYPLKSAEVFKDVDQAKLYLSECLPKLNKRRILTVPLHPAPLSYDAKVMMKIELEREKIQLDKPLDGRII